MRARFWLGAAVVVLLTGCTHRVWFTHPLRESWELGAGGPDPAQEKADKQARQPDQLQYFVSERIVLRRRVDSAREGIVRGRLVVRRGRLVDQVLVRRGTPGVAVDWGPDWIAVSFEKGTRLVFERIYEEDKPNLDREPANVFGEKPPRGLYRLRTDTDAQGTASIQFEGQVYELAGSTADARLKVKRSAFTRKRKRRRVLRGRRI